MRRTRCPVRRDAGLSNMPDYVIEIICSYLVGFKLSRCDRNMEWDILREVPEAIRNLRVTCWRFCIIIDCYPFKFSLSINEYVLANEAAWDKLEIKQRHTFWDISTIRFNLYWGQNGAGEMDGGESKLKRIGDFFNKFADMLMVQRVILLWYGCRVNSDFFSKFVSFLGQFVGNGFVDSFKITFLKPEWGDFSQWSEFALLPNVDVVKVLSHDDLVFGSTATEEMTECFRAFPSLRYVSFGYLVEDLTPITQLCHLMCLEIKSFELSLPALTFRLPSVTHLLLTLSNCEPDVEIADFLSATFPNLEILRLEVEEEFRGRLQTHKCLVSESCHTAQIPAIFLPVLSKSTDLKNLEILQFYQEELKNLKEIAADLDFLSICYTGDWKKCAESILKRFENLRFLEIRVAHGHYSQRKFLKFVKKNQRLFQKCSIKLLVLMNDASTPNKVVFMKHCLKDDDIKHYHNVLRLLEEGKEDRYTRRISITRECQPSDGYYIKS